MRVCLPQFMLKGALLLGVLLLGLSFLPLSRAFAQESTSLTPVSIDGLVFLTYPDFQTIDFSIHNESLDTVDVTHEETQTVSLDSFDFSDSPTPSPTDAPTLTDTPTPTSTPTPTIVPTTTQSVLITETTVSPSPSPIPTATPTPSATPTPLPSPTPTPQPVVGDAIWDQLATCESHNNWSIDTGNGYFGGLQFSQGAWNSVGGTGKPSDASRETQIEMGKKLQALRGWGAWGECARKLGLL